MSWAVLSCQSPSSCSQQADPLPAPSPPTPAAPRVTRMSGAVVVPGSYRVLGEQLQSWLLGPKKQEEAGGPAAVWGMQ